MRAEVEVRVEGQLIARAMAEQVGPRVAFSMGFPDDSAISQVLVGQRRFSNWASSFDVSLYLMQAQPYPV